MFSRQSDQPACLPDADPEALQEGQPAPVRRALPRLEQGPAELYAGLSLTQLCHGDGDPPAGQARKLLLMG